jgi:hypothetical protein
MTMDRNLLSALTMPLLTPVVKRGGETAKSLMLTGSKIAVAAFAAATEGPRPGR